VKQTLMPLSTERLIKTIESNQSTTMFYNRGDIRENSIRQLARLGQALDKYPPVYLMENDGELYTVSHIF
jgi:hypothetical protein